MDKELVLTEEVEENTPIVSPNGAREELLLVGNSFYIG